MEILVHEKEHVNFRSIQHSVLVKSVEKPDARDIAIKVGYHPAGYGIRDAKVAHEFAENEWAVTWLSSDNCD